MNRERIETLITILEESKAGNWGPSFDKDGVAWWVNHNGDPKGLHMGTWGTQYLDEGDEPCGFVACVIGHAALDSRCPWVEVDENEDPHEISLLFPEGSWVMGSEIASLTEALDLDSEQVKHIFFPDAYPGLDHDHDEVIRRLKEVLS